MSGPCVSETTQLIPAETADVELKSGGVNDPGGRHAAPGGAARVQPRGGRAHHGVLGAHPGEVTAWGAHLTHTKLLSVFIYLFIGWKPNPTQLNPNRDSQQFGSSP